MKKIIVYFPYPLRVVNSGSAVRPQKILKAFKSYGELNNIQIISIYGESKERKHQLKEMYKSIDEKEVLFCYMENATLPYWLTDTDHIPRTPFLELTFFRYLKKNNIPLGIFYRDIYWKFDDYVFKGYKRLIMKKIYMIEKIVYDRYADYIFLPSLDMNKFSEFNNKTSALPPGADDNFRKINTKYHPNKNKFKAIYVGGLSEGYGIPTLLESIANINKTELILELKLVCRQHEFELNKELFSRYKNEKWLKISHLSGKELEDVYKNVDFGILPLKKTLYNDFAVPVKLFEYLSYGLPIVATNCKAQEDIVINNKNGLICNDTTKSLKESILKIMDSELLIKLRENAKISLYNGNLWINRVEKVHRQLLSDNLGRDS